MMVCIYGCDPSYPNITLDKVKLTGGEKKNVSTTVCQELQAP